LGEENIPRLEDAFGGRGAQVPVLRQSLLAWYAACRRDLPWRRTRDPYAVWVSEIMLQQTRVDTVLPYYERFLARFPTVHALAEAKEDDVLACWSGLGYYRRARLLHRGARAVAGAGGVVPKTRAGLLGVPGIGRYTAGAVASIAFGEPVGLVDGNVARVLARIFAIEDDMRKGGMKRAEAIADALVAPEDPGAFNQALMELGATICTPRNPRCDGCPVASSCAARARGRTDELPLLSAKKAPKPVRVQSFVLVRGDRVALARRKPDRAFGGLWEPPRVDGGEELRASTADALGGERCERVATVEHVLSHRRLRVDVVVGGLAKGVRAMRLPEDYAEARLVRIADLASSAAELGISTLTRKILARALLWTAPPASGDR
jgi:A/G-specific adenine glycosylase